MHIDLAIIIPIFAAQMSENRWFAPQVEYGA
jgi:hypothetical protein